MTAEQKVVGGIDRFIRIHTADSVSRLEQVFVFIVAGELVELRKIVDVAQSFVAVSND